MRTVILGERPVEIERLIAQRHAAGADTHDEVWEGVYHMAPAPQRRHALLALRLAVRLEPYVRARALFGSTEFNLGEPNDYRVPDYGVHRAEGSLAYVPTAALVGEIMSPGDESWEKLPFYAAHGVDEAIIVDPADRSLVWMALDEGEYQRIDHSGLLDVAVATFYDAIDWPPSDA